MSDTVRIDKWLWAARFFKTRGLAREAIKGGKVQLDGHRVKPSRTLAEGDRLNIRRGDDEYEITVTDVGRAARRPPSSASSTGRPAPSARGGPTSVSVARSSVSPSARPVWEWL
jgi:ribosome-associated heat shock protein Hsp15